MGKEGRFQAAFLLVAASLLSTLLLAATGPSGASADNGPTIGFAMLTGDTPASSAGDSGSCVSVSAGEEFYADVFVTNVDSLTAWELRVDYDPSVVSLESADYNFLLVKTGGQIFPSEFEQEKPGRMFLAAAETSSPDSGSGILARLHMKALSSGASSLQITTNPVYYGPRLTGARGAKIGDTNGDGIFDATVTDGSVEVGRSCAASTPGATLTPGQASPLPGSGTSAPPAGSGGSSSGGDAAPLGSGVAGSGDDTATPGSGNEQQTDPPSGPLVENAGSTGASEPTSAAGAQVGDSNGQATNNGDKTGQNAKQNSGASSSTLVIVIAGVFAVLAILVGAGLIIVRPSTQRRQ